MYSATVSREGEANSVIRNTYLLLSMTLLGSAATAYLGTQVQMGLWGYLGCVIAGFALLFATMAFRDSALGLVFVFLFTGVEGFSLGPVMNHYLNMRNGAEIISLAAGLTAIIFVSLSAYVLTTRKNFEFLGGMLFVGLVMLLVASIANIFFAVPGVSLALAAIGALIFSGYILYDTSRIVHGGETNYIMATVSLYLDILNLFLDLLRLVAFASNDD